METQFDGNSSSSNLIHFSHYLQDLSPTASGSGTGGNVGKLVEEAPTEVSVARSNVDVDHVDATLEKVEKVSELKATANTQRDESSK